MGGLTIGQDQQPASDYEKDYVIGIRRPKFRGAGAPLAPPGSATWGVSSGLDPPPLWPTI